ncbi:MAG: enoyl-CoA hydratase/isomerase family protein [Flammeovirgaceae bacterium]|mgnify:CR=1 FL=1|jgi:enoyl-CoA hydratase|nr:enoyl-CoA hydratase/isomerase family protein [Flammeovirgaceae bacterium]|tara:strand:- start:31870 stop:32664 length:795 start_codon:yes stop_codon:yes gene_type:complete
MEKINGTYNNLELNLNGKILVIEISREQKLNALNHETLKELKQVIGSLENADVSGAIIIGAGEKAFVAGADISEFQKMDEETARRFSEAGQQVFELIERCHTPVIAVINGFALGGGCELAMACHLRIAVETAKFGQPEVNLGILPGYGGTQRLTQLIGKGRALEYMMTANMMDAKTALNYGLVNHVEANKEAALIKAFDILNKISEKAPIAIGLVVDCVNAVFDGGKNGYEIEASAFAKCCATDDFSEGANAFIEKRKPNFTGT